MSNNNNNNAASNGIGFCGVLFITFFVLKVTGYLDWSWLWILSPLWIPTFIVGVILTAFGIYRFIKTKRYICLFKGHNYEGKYERKSLPYGFVDHYVERCTRCGKIK